MIFSGCVSAPQNVILQNQALSFTINGQTITKKLNQPVLQYYPGMCITEAFTIKSEDIFMEKIQLGSNCHWNGFSRGFFTSLFDEKLKLKRLKMTENVDVKNYELSMYQVNDTSYVGLIYVYGTFTDVLIWDYDGAFYEEVLSALTQKPLRDIQQPRFRADYNHALARYNFFYNYYGKTFENKYPK